MLPHLKISILGRSKSAVCFSWYSGACLYQCAQRLPSSPDAPHSTMKCQITCAPHCHTVQCSAHKHAALSMSIGIGCWGGQTRYPAPPAWEPKLWDNIFTENLRFCSNKQKSEDDLTRKVCGLGDSILVCILTNKFTNILFDHLIFFFIRFSLKHLLGN